MGLRTNFDKPDVMKELSKQLINADGVLQVKKPKKILKLVVITFFLLTLLAHDDNWSGFELP